MTTIFELVSVGHVTAFFAGWIICYEVNFVSRKLKEFLRKKELEPKVEVEKEDNCCKEGEISEVETAFVEALCDHKNDRSEKIKFTVEEKKMFDKIRLKKPLKRVPNRSYTDSVSGNFMNYNPQGGYVKMEDLDPHQSEYERCRLTDSEKSFIRDTLYLKFKDKKYKYVRAALAKRGFSTFISIQRNEYPIYYDPTVINLKLANEQLKDVFHPSPFGVNEFMYQFDDIQKSKYNEAFVVGILGPLCEDDNCIRAMEKAKEKEKENENKPVR